MHTYDGFDRLYNSVFNTATGLNESYPPYNIREVDEVTRVVEIAVAGFAKDEIELTVDRSLLKIRAEKKEKPVGKYVHQGIALRKFVRGMTIADFWEVSDAEVIDGILTITFKYSVPEDKQIKYITVK